MPSNEQQFERAVSEVVPLGFEYLDCPMLVQPVTDNLAPSGDHLILAKELLALARKLPENARKAVLGQDHAMELRSLALESALTEISRQMNAPVSPELSAWLASAPTFREDDGKRVRFQTADEDFWNARPSK